MSTFFNSILLEAKGKGESKLEWKGAIAVKDPEYFAKFLNDNDLKLPSNLISFLKTNNGAKPSHRVKFSIKNSKNESTLRHFLSINHSKVNKYATTIYGVYKYLNGHDNKDKDNSKLVPFAVDDGSNYICCKDGSDIS